MNAILEYPASTNVHELRRFLGLAGFLRRFIHKFATVADPLYTLLKDNTEFVWNNDCVHAFNDLKQKIASYPVLRIFNLNATIELRTDASAKGLAAILFQKASDNKFHPVYTISRRTSEVEKSYHSSKLELLAIVWAVSRLRSFLININFKIVTDSQALLYLNTQKTKNPQIIR